MRTGNYFELYDLPIDLHPDQGKVKAKFYELSKKYHPDFYIQESEEKQEEALQLATLNNNAFQILKDPYRTLEYLLQLYELIREGESYVLPQDFLMEMMEMNEALMELQMGGVPSAKEELDQQIRAFEDSLQVEFRQLSEAFAQAKEADKHAVLLRIKDHYYRHKYLLRMKENLKKGR